MICCLANLSPMPRRHWATVTVPRSLAAKAPTECTFELGDGRRWRAVRGKSAGNKTVFRVRATMDGAEMTTGRITATAHKDAAEMRWHPWTSDDVRELIPYVGIADDPSSQSITWASNVDVHLVDSSPAHQRWWIRQRIHQYGVHVSYWIDVLHDDPVAHFYGKVVWSDRGDPASVRRFGQIWLRCGEAIALDFARRNAIGQSFPVGDDWVIPLASNISMIDGSGLPLSGSILAFVSAADGPPPVDPGDHSDEINIALQGIVAASRGPILGVCHEWQGSWLACRNVPRLIDEIDVEHLADVAWNAFDDAMQQPAGWHGDRLFGLSRTPGQTGSQDDFGATKGTYAVLAYDARMIHAWKYAAQVECLRGHNHYEVDGSMLTAATHPNWCTWSRITHWHPSVSTDRLGKSVGIPFEPWMHAGVDDEHMSHNYLAAYAALADDPLIEDQIRHMLETDRAGYRFRYPNNGAGATRAQGRTAGAWAQLMTVSDDQTAAGFADLLVRRVAQTMSMASIQVGGSMKVPAWGMPDGRKPIFDAQGNLARWTSMWELGLFLVGMYQLQRTGRQPAGLDDVLLAASSTMAEFGFFQQDGDWFTVADIAWNEGAPPAGGLKFPSTQLTSMIGAGDVCSWTFAGILVARSVLPRSHPHWHRMNQYVMAITGGNEATMPDVAEWWAVVDSIVLP